MTFATAFIAMLVRFTNDSGWFAAHTRSLRAGDIKARCEKFIAS